MNAEKGGAAGSWKVKGRAMVQSIRRIVQSLERESWP